MTIAASQPEATPAKQFPKVQRHKSNPPAQYATIKSKKEGSLPLPQVVPVASNTPKEAPQLQTTQTQSQVKKLSRKSSKPIINWLQRKLAGTRARRASEGDALRAQRIPNARPTNGKEKRRSSVPVPPLPPAPVRQRSRHSGKPQPHRASSAVASVRQNTISLDSDQELRSLSDGHSIDSDSDDHRRASSVLESTWSPNSVYEADEDASVRPIPPSAPPSPSPSLSSSSYLSHPRTFASMAASTKPTTLLSVDLTGGMAHIAQAPPTPTIPAHRMSPHVRTHSAGLSGGSITFSMLPPASPSRPSSSTHGHMPSVSSRGHPQPTLQAPQHTTHHPRNNPRPSSPPMDDASVLTLASSAFGIPNARIGAAALARSGRASVADDSMSHFSHPLGGDSTSQFLLGDGEQDDDRTEEHYVYGDVDASVRALRPRSSRRGSWESEASGWSARVTGVQGTGTAGTHGGPKERSAWTTGSHKTDAKSTQTEHEGEEDLDIEPPKSLSTEKRSSAGDDATSTFSAQEPLHGPNAISIQEDTRSARSSKSPVSTTSEVRVIPSTEKALETPKRAAVPLDEIDGCASSQSVDGTSHNQE